MSQKLMRTFEAKAGYLDCDSEVENKSIPEIKKRVRLESRKKNSRKH